MSIYSLLSFDEMQEVGGGKGLGWLGLLQPAYDFLRGIGSGFMDACKRDDQEGDVMEEKRFLEMTETEMLEERKS